MFFWRWCSMDSGLDRDLILEMYVTETQELLDQLEQLVLDSEQDGGIRSIVHEVFRIMHTIKGSSTTMAFENMAVLSHSIEDIFFYIREGKADSFDEHGLTNIVLVSIDFMKGEIEKIKEGGQPDGDASGLIDEIQTFLSAMKQEGSHPSKESPVSPLKRYKAVVVFEEDCQMENIRAFLMVNKLKAVAKDISYQPPDISENEESAQVIREKGFLIELTSELGIDEIQSNLEGNSFVKHIKLEEVPAAHSYEDKSRQNENHTVQGKQMDDAGSGPSKTSRSRESSDRFERISVDVHKLDNLLDMVGELVISQAMVVQHPELKGLPLEEFYDAVGHLQKITTDLQDIVMSIRMVPLSMTFQKMHRIVRDMSSKFGKDVQLKIIGAETEVDKNIIDHISDPLMHLIRNAVDHGIETIEERVQRGKPGKGTITLEAKTWVEMSGSSLRMTAGG